LLTVGPRVETNSSRPLSSAVHESLHGTERQFAAPRLFVSVGSWPSSGAGQIVRASVLSDVRMDGVGEIVSRVERRRRWTPLGKAGSAVDELMRAPAGQRAYAERGDPPHS